MKKKILIINADYYLHISSGLEAAAKFTLQNESNAKIKYEIINVPGILEVPFVISKNIRKFDAFIALGCVIKGETPHFNFISKTTFNSIMKLSIDKKKPIGNGIITALNMSQANRRSQNNENISKKLIKDKLAKRNKGREAARAVLSLLGILKNGKK